MSNEIRSIQDRAKQGEIPNYLTGNNGVTEKIKRAMYDAAKQFVYIGFLLWEVEQYKYFIAGGYKDVYDYAAQELNFKRSSTKNFIAIARTFGNKYYDQYNQIYSQLPTMNLKPEYKDFNYSQLVEMLAMSDKQREQVKPDMTIRQIREIKKAAMEPEFALDPKAETIKIPLPDDDAIQDPEPAASSQTSGQKLEYTITLDRCDWELIIEQLDDNIKYNYGDPEVQDEMIRIRDAIKGIIEYT